VRGYDTNTLGPRDSLARPFGGSSKIIGNAELFFPVPFMPETKSIRLGTFFDAGTVSDGFKVDNLRYSAGLSGEWLSPFGALSVSIAVPLNSGRNEYIDNNNVTQSIEDDKKYFQFNFGQNF
jgi:outer membrane protein insertion porin family